MWKALSKELDEKSKRIAENELNEKSSKQVASDIEYIRKWMLKTEHLKAPTDDDFILRFLRCAKFSYTKAQLLIENYLSCRTEMPEFFTSRHLDDMSVLMELADQGLFMLLPYPDEHGRLVAIMRPGLWDTKKFEFDDLAKYLTCLADVAWSDQRTNIYGLVFIFDLVGLNSDHASYATYARVQKVAKCIEKTYPLRVKAVHIFNYPKIFEVIFSVIKGFLHEKLKKRIHFHGSDAHALHQFFSKKLLPMDYGGEAYSLEETNENWIEHVRTKESYLQSLLEHGIDKTKQITNGSKITANVNGDAPNGVIGTFRKLNID